MGPRVYLLPEALGRGQSPLHKMTQASGCTDSTWEPTLPTEGEGLQQQSMCCMRKSPRGGLCAIQVIPGESTCGGPPSQEDAGSWATVRKPACAAQRLFSILSLVKNECITPRFLCPWDFFFSSLLLLSPTYHSVTDFRAKGHSRRII